MSEYHSNANTVMWTPQGEASHAAADSPENGSSLAVSPRHRRFLQFNKDALEPPSDVTTITYDTDMGSALASIGNAIRTVGGRSALAPEKVVRFAGLSLVLLFPLLSVLQLGDSDSGWRRAAQSVRGSILVVHRPNSSSELRNVATKHPRVDNFLVSNAPPVGCGVVIQNNPLRLVVAGRSLGEILVTPTPKGWIHWQTVFTDEQGDFSILQARSEANAETSGASSYEYSRIPAVKLDFERESQREGVRAALVGPKGFSDQPLWAGVLTNSQDPSGRPYYLSNLLRPVRDIAMLSTNEAYADQIPEIDPVLRGAPFVDSDGNVVALYLGQSSRGAEALPIDIIASTLVMLHLRISQ